VSPPAQIGKELVFRREKHFLTFPKFALGNKNALSVDADEDVRLALEIESFAGRLSLEDAVKLHEEVRAQILLSHIMKGMGAEFHDPHHIPHDIENLLIILF
jgi:hypothetical protein